MHANSAATSVVQRIPALATALSDMYYSTGNKFERFREFLELISRFEFEFCQAKIIFSEGFEFLVCSCECAVACLCPRNSISNVVASVTIHDDMYKYMYIFFM